MANAIPTWQNVQSNFGGSNQSLANAQQGFARAGAGADAILQRYSQDEQNAIVNARAQEQLDLQKQQFGLQQKQYDDAQAAKAAGSKYMADMSKVLESGVVSQADQEKLGILANNAGEAYKRGDMKTYNALQGQLAELTSAGSLKAMSDAYQKNDAAKLQLLQGVTASPMMDTRDKVALLGSVADPLEKRLDADTKYGYDVKLQETANAKALELAKLQHDYRLAEQEAETKAQLSRFDRLEKAKQDMTPMYNKTGTRVLYKDLTPEQLKSGEWFDKDTQTARLNAADKAFEQKTKSDEIEIKKTEAVRKQREEVDKLVANAGNPSSTGQIVAEMRQNKMPESAIYSALSTATGGGAMDFGKPDYDTGRLEDVLSGFKSTGATPNGTEKADQETAKKETDKQIADIKARRDLLKKEAELSPKEQEELTGIETRLKAIDAADKKAADKAEIEKILSKKPSQLTSKERDILNAYKYGYIPGTNIPASADIAGVTY